MSKSSPSVIRRSNELLATKLEIPLLGTRIVQRQRLTQLLQFALDRRLTLLVAPAGYGKTTLLGEWVSTLSPSEWRTAWVSLDAIDNTSLRFWSYITAALQKAYPKLRFNPQDLVAREYDPWDFSVFHPLFNEIAQIPASVCLILDDYQVIRDESIHASLAYLLERQPANLHLVIASRTSPPIPLARLRAQHQLLGLSAHDLAFTLPEAKTFLSSIMDLQLDATQIAALINNTEGWITGLQLAALSYQGQPSTPPSRTHSVSGDNRQILDYLSEEVLDRQTPEIKGFLLATSILTELSAPLCNALLGRSDSDRILVEIEQAKLFITCLDNQGKWYRYHPLFAETLQQLLRRIHPEQIYELHRRAGEWLYDQGYHEQAISHLLAIGDLKRSAEILDSSTVDAIQKIDTVGTIQRFSHCSDELISYRPRLGIYSAMVNFQYGNVEEMHARLEVVEKTLEQARKTQAPIFDEPLIRWELGAMLAAEEFLRANFNQGIIQYLEMMRTAPPEDVFWIGNMCLSLAFAYEITGNLEAALRWHEKAVEYANKQNLGANYIVTHCQIAKIRKRQGRLSEAQQEYEIALDFTRKSSRDDVIAQSGLMEIAIERQDNETADRWAGDVKNYVERTGSSLTKAHTFEMVAARLAYYYLSKGEAANAEAIFKNVIDGMPKTAHRFEYPYSEAIHVQMRLALRAGKDSNGIHSFKEWIDRLDPKQVFAEDEQTALAHLYLAQNQPGLAITALQDVERISRRIGDQERLLEVMLLLAQAYQMEGQDQLAYQAIEEAVWLAEPEGYIYPFLEEGEAVRRLIEQAMTRRSEAATDEMRRWDGHARKLIEAFKRCAGTANQVVLRDPATTTLTIPLEEPLSPRESEVLAMLLDGKTMKEVAGALMISLNTARAHTQNINRKFGTHDRRSLLQRANELMGRRG